MRRTLLGRDASQGFRKLVSVATVGECFVSICRSYADRDQLQAIYSAYLQPVLSSSLKSHPVWGAVKNIHTLAGSMVAVYEQVSGFQVLRVCSLGYALSILIQHRHSFERAQKS